MSVRVFTKVWAAPLLHHETLTLTFFFNHVKPTAISHVIFLFFFRSQTSSANTIRRTKDNNEIQINYKNYNNIKRQNPPHYLSSDWKDLFQGDDVGLKWTNIVERMRNENAGIFLEYLTIHRQIVGFQIWSLLGVLNNFFLLERFWIIDLFLSTVWREDDFLLSFLFVFASFRYFSSFFLFESFIFFVLKRIGQWQNHKNAPISWEDFGFGFYESKKTNFVKGSKGWQTIRLIAQVAILEWVNRLL